MIRTYVIAFNLQLIRYMMWFHFNIHYRHTILGHLGNPNIDIRNACYTLSRTLRRPFLSPPPSPNHYHNLSDADLGDLELKRVLHAAYPATR